MKITPADPTFLVRFPSGSSTGSTRVAIKDLIDVAGVPTANGSRAAIEVPSRDAACLAGIRRAEAGGEVRLLGKTNQNELAFGVSGINPWYGTPSNPWNPDLVPGGSSSGSAVAVARGEADVAVGSDTGGSIRIPAACCGVAGLKTTRGRIPLRGVRPLAPSLDTVGPLGATAASVVQGMRLLESGFEPDRRPAQRVGRLRLPTEDWIDRAVDASLRLFEVVEVELPGWETATAAAMTVLMSEAWQTHADLWAGHREELSQEVASRLALAAEVSFEQVAAARGRAAAWDEELRLCFEDVDLLALPVLAGGPPTLAEAGRLASIRYGAAFNLAGIPALALPVGPPSSVGGQGASAGGPPASLQLAGPAGSEELLLASALAIEEEQGPSGAGRRGGLTER